MKEQLRKHLDHSFEHQVDLKQIVQNDLHPLDSFCPDEKEKIEKIIKILSLARFSRASLSDIVDEWRKNPELIRLINCFDEGVKREVVYWVVDSLSERVSYDYLSSLVDGHANHGLPSDSELAVFIRDLFDVIEDGDLSHAADFDKPLLVVASWGLTNLLRKRMHQLLK